MLQNFFAHGFTLLSERLYWCISSTSGYLGVQRYAFDPEIPADPQSYDDDPTSEGKIWRYTPPGWRQDAYRVYEANWLKEADDHFLSLLSTYDAARKIQQIITPHVGLDTYTIFESMVATADLSDRLINTQFTMPGVDLGYDVAYTGGDMFSAIYAEFIGFTDMPTPIEDWAREYETELNQYKLFSDVSTAVKFLENIRTMWKSEANADFGIYRLREVVK